MGLAKVLEALNPYFWYFIESPKAKVCLKDRSKVTAILNTGAKINVMIKNLIEDANLAMRQELKQELVSNTGHSCSF